MIKQIYDHLGIDGSRRQTVFDAYLESQKNYQKNKFELTPELRDKINAKLGILFCTLWDMSAKIEHWTEFCS